MPPVPQPNSGADLLVTREQRGSVELCTKVTECIFDSESTDEAWFRFQSHA